ncbi:CGNR zinc finger domain-containing protein [Streptomyces sp. HM190]|uniref:CGNR zinc finger domain-containing protein n=1 Tax=Streptomyces sp. HM190 TaxID=2695266 RepID=UPI00135ABE19|nr:CGNR zinc finger domain-containing protein [Streptomyces sp. HM190]
MSYTPRFDCGRRCLDLLATSHPEEHLTSPGDLRRWITAAALVPEDTPLDHVTPDWLPAFQELRGHTARLVHPVASPTTRSDPDAYEASLARVNDLARPAPPAPVAVRTDTGVLTRALAHTPDRAALLAVVARDTVELLTDPVACAGLRQCAGDNCPIVYVDTSRGRRRRWCSSEICGNRERVARHRRRTALSRA